MDNIYRQRVNSVSTVGRLSRVSFIRDSTVEVSLTMAVCIVAISPPHLWFLARASKFADYESIMLLVALAFLCIYCHIVYMAYCKYILYYTLQ